jgi:hypothetical protein
MAFKFEPPIIDDFINFLIKYLGNITLKKAAIDESRRRQPASSTLDESNGAMPVFWMFKILFVILHQI